MHFKDIFSVSLVLFSAMDILGSIPIVLKLREDAGSIESRKATFFTALFMYAFLFMGQYMLQLFGLDVQTFSIAGGLVIFLMGLEMTMGLTLFRYGQEGVSSSVVPLAFPIIAGPGTLTTILTLRVEFTVVDIAIGTFLNLIFVYFVLKNTAWLARILGPSGIQVIRTMFGVILLALAVKIMRNAFLL